MRKYIFWGILFITTGLLWLLRISGLITFSWLDFLSLWPLILIWIGIGLLPIRSGYKVLMDILTLIVGLVLILTPVKSHLFPYNRKETVLKKITHFVKDDFQTASLTFNTGATEIKFIPGNNNLIDIYGDNSENVKMNISRNGGRQHANIDLKIAPKPGYNVMNGPYEITLDTDPVWDMDINLGASQNSIDLSEFKVRNLDLSSGASDIYLKIGDYYPEVDIDLSMGASAIRIEIPSTMNCEIEKESAISNADFKDFIKSDRNHYYSTVPDSLSKGSIKIQISSGVSDIKVTRY